MEADSLKALQADVTAQMSLIKRVTDVMEERAQGWQPNNAAQMESVAYQIHNLYNAVEDLLKLVANHFENHIVDSSQWHTELLFRMSQAIDGVRPAFLSEECYILLNSLRGFRHFFRHAYNVPIEAAQLELNLEKARKLYPCLSQDVKLFLQQLGIG